MTQQARSAAAPFPRVTAAVGDLPRFSPGEQVRVAVRHPLGHYRVPRYIRGHTGVVQWVIEPRTVNNEEEGFGRNAGLKRYYYRIAIRLSDLWPDYASLARDEVRIEVHESWLEEVRP